MATMFAESTAPNGLGISLDYEDAPTAHADNEEEVDDPPIRPSVSQKATGLSEKTLHPNTNVNIYNFTCHRNAGELNAILGDEESRVKSRSSLAKLSEAESDERNLALHLEKAKPNSRVDVDLFLENDTCVEGGVMRGRVDVRVRENKKKAPILISGGKLRVIGFETISGDAERFTFYQCSALLSDIASGYERLCSSESDQEGFSTAQEGVHHLPFELSLNSSEGGTIPKGTTFIKEGLSVCYIVMVSFRIKDPVSGKKSIAHFYRNCVIWPRLNPSTVMAPTSRPLQLSAKVQTGKAGEICLTASLHRLHWVAGQLCHIQLKIFNRSNKALESITFDLLKTITVFKIMKKPDGDEPHLQSSHQTKSVSQSVLSIAEHGKRGHASAAGWWAGIAPGETQTLRYAVPIPDDELSIPRGKLLQVSYNLRTTVSGAKRRTKDVQVSLPIEIINFLSIDPPPSSVISAPAGVYRETSISDQIDDQDSEEEDGRHSQPSYYDHQDEREYGHDEVGNLPMHDDTDEVVQHAVSHARIDAEYGKSAPRFSDLYYAALHEKAQNHVHQPSVHDAQEIEEFQEIPGKNQFKDRFEARRREHMNLRRKSMLEEQLMREEINAGLRDPSDAGYFPKVETDSSTECRSQCTCGNGTADSPHGRELPRPPKSLARSLVSSRSTPRHRLYDEPLSGQHEAHYDDNRQAGYGAGTLSVPCQTPGQISSPSIPRSGTVKERIKTLEALDDDALP